MIPTPQPRNKSTYQYIKVPQLRTSRNPGQRIDIKVLAKNVSESYNVSIDELRSGGRRRAVVQPRRAMPWIGVRELGYSGADDVARNLGVTNSGVT